MKQSRLFIILGFIMLSSLHLNGQTKSKSLEKLEFCSLFNILKQYDGKIISMNAYMFFPNGPSDVFFYSPKCNTQDYFVVEDSSKQKDFDKWQKIIFRELNKDNKSHILEVNLIGKLHQAFIPSYGNLSWSLSEIETLKIKSVKDITNDSNTIQPDFGAETPLLNAGKKLDFDSMLLWVSLFGINQALFGTHQISKELPEVLLDDFVFTDLDGNSFNKYQYLNQKNPILGANEFFSDEKRYIKRVNNKLVMTEILKIKAANKKTKQIKCEMIFQQINGFYYMSSAKLSYD